MQSIIHVLSQVVTQTFFWCSQEFMLVTWLRSRVEMLRSRCRWILNEP